METAGASTPGNGNLWDCLTGQVLDSRFEVGKLLQVDRGGAWLQSRDAEQNAEVLLFLEDEEQPGTAGHFDRFREASFLNHPNLVRVYAAGRATCADRSFIYLATETGESDLAEELRVRPFSHEEAERLLREMTSALNYLHSENLVSCAVRPGGIWRVNGQWKLADFTELRVPGRVPAQETRRLMILPAFECPPEASEGTISPAWDVWSLGSILRKVFPRKGKIPFVPPPFDGIVALALDPEPAARPTLDYMVHLMESADPGAVRESPERLYAVPEPAPEITTQETPRVRHMDAPFFRHDEQRTGTLQGNRTAILAGVLLALAAAFALFLFYPVRKVQTGPVPAAMKTPASVAPQSEAASDTPSDDPRPPSPFGNNNPVTGSASQAQKQITVVLDRWASAKRRRNVDDELACYAPSVDRFYGQRSVPSSTLRRQERDVYARIGNVQKFDLSNVKFDRLSEGWAVVSFDKTWDFVGRTRFSGSSREEVVLRPVHGQWKISSQREKKVYWVRKQATHPAQGL